MNAEVVVQTGALPSVDVVLGCWEITEVGSCWNLAINTVRKPCAMELSKRRPSIQKSRVRDIQDKELRNMSTMTGSNEKQ